MVGGGGGGGVRKKRGEGACTPAQGQGRDSRREETKEEFSSTLSRPELNLPQLSNTGSDTIRR